MRNNNVNNNTKRDELKDKVLDLRRVTRVVKGGKRLSFLGQQLLLEI